MLITESLRGIIKFLKINKIPYMIFGGIANSIYGNPRQTFDINIKIQFDFDKKKLQNEFLKELTKIAIILVDEPGNFINETNVLPIEIKGVKVDLVFAQLPFEIEAIASARKIEFSGISMKVCGVEDFIVHKSISQRKKDWLDIEVVIEYNIKEIDWRYLLKHVKDLSMWLDDPEIYDRILKMKK